MDIQMPEMDGLEATRHIMQDHPTPVVIVSGLLEQDIDLSLNALEAGALAVVGKPPQRSDPAFSHLHTQFIRTLRAMSEVKVISRRRYASGITGHVKPSAQSSRKPEVLVIGASTGGPSALHQLLANLPAPLAVPVVITQHMPGEFIEGLARWLDEATPLQVQIARHGHVIRPGQVRIAPGSAHLMLARRHDYLVTRLISETGAYRYRPSVDALFYSTAQSCDMAAIGLILTGMGDDGAAGLLAMREAGATTLAQDEASSIVFGMPRAALDRGAAERSVSLTNLPSEIAKLL
jgi:two-component system chemotaxis response regulator CheB